MRLRGMLPLVVTLCLSAPLSARADTKDSCIAAAEEADLLRRDMTKLTKAQEKLRVCAAEECPAIVRDDCRRWVVEVDANLPTVVFVAEDENGKPVFDVSVTIDGQPLLDHLDGTPMVIEAGAHTFNFARAGEAPLAVPVFVRAGQKNVEVAGRYPRLRPLIPNAQQAPTAEPPKSAETPGPSPGRSTLAYLSLGGGVVGLVGIGVGTVFGLHAASLQSSARCPSNVCGSDGSPDTLRDAKTSGNIATGFLVGGGILAVGGIALFLIAPRSAASRGAMIRPIVVAGGGGIVLEASR